MKFYLHGNRSLKEKRRIVNSIKDRLKNKFNVSLAEVGDQDIWQNLHIGMVAVSSDVQYLNSVLDQAINFIDNMHLAQMTDCRIKILNMENWGTEI